MLRELQENNGVYVNTIKNNLTHSKPKGKKKLYREDPPEDNAVGNEQAKKVPHKRPRTRSPDAIMKANEVLKDKNVKKSRS